MFRRTASKVKPSELARAVAPTAGRFFYRAYSSGTAFQQQNDNFEEKARVESRIHEMNHHVAVAEADLNKKKKELNRLRQYNDKLQEPDQGQERSKAGLEDVMQVISDAVYQFKLEGKTDGYGFLNSRSISLPALGFFKKLLDQYGITYQLEEHQGQVDLSDNLKLKIPEEFPKNVQAELTANPECNRWLADLKYMIETAQDNANKKILQDYSKLKVSLLDPLILGDQKAHLKLDSSPVAFERIRKEVEAMDAKISREHGYIFVEKDEPKTEQLLKF